MTTEEFVKVYWCLDRIKALCENPHWTAERKLRILDNVQQAVEILNAAEKQQTKES